MSPSDMEPEYIVELSEKIALTGKQLANFVLALRDLEVDSRVLSTELTKLEGFSGRIAGDIRELVLLLQDMQDRGVTG